MFKPGRDLPWAQQRFGMDHLNEKNKWAQPGKIEGLELNWEQKRKLRLDDSDAHINESGKRKKKENLTLIFLCEKSNEKGLDMCKFFRDYDRSIHGKTKRKYSEVYVMRGGYSEFQKKFKMFCRFERENAHEKSEDKQIREKKRLSQRKTKHISNKLKKEKKTIRNKQKKTETNLEPKTKKQSKPHKKSQKNPKNKKIKAQKRQEKAKIVFQAPNYGMWNPANFFNPHNPVLNRNPNGVHRMQLMGATPYILKQNTRAQQASKNLEATPVIPISKAHQISLQKLNSKNKKVLKKNKYGKIKSQNKNKYTSAKFQFQSAVPVKNLVFKTNNKIYK